MQLELSPEIEGTLASEAKALGLTAAELSAQLLTRHAARWHSRSKGETNRSGRPIDDYIAHIISRNPDYKTTDPYAADWQAVKAEGRRF